VCLRITRYVLCGHLGCARPCVSSSRKRKSLQADQSLRDITTRNLALRVDLPRISRSSAFLDRHSEEVDSRLRCVCGEKETVEWERTSRRKVASRGSFGGDFGRSLVWSPLINKMNIGTERRATCVSSRYRILPHHRVSLINKIKIVQFYSSTNSNRSHTTESDLFTAFQCSCRRHFPPSA
jgi:hypothetical protein